MSNASSSGEVTDAKSPFPMSEAVWQEIANRLALSPQQIRIVELLLRNKQDKEIAAELGLSFPTVRTYLRRIFDRVGVKDRMGLVLHVFAIAQDRIASKSCQ